jgi:hypothetical protein
MGPRKYPREPLAQLRAKQVGDAAQALAKAARVRQEAERVASSLDRAREAAETAARMAGAGEQTLLERGELRAADLMHASAWMARVAVDRAQLEQRAANSAERARAARAVEDGARDAVASAHAQEQVVSRDAERWRDAERTRALAEDEEDTNESWRKR